MVENFYKMFNWYMSLDKLTKTYKNIVNTFWKCDQHKGTFYHGWWTSNKAKMF